jgi:hypothetical protein
VTPARLTREQARALQAHVAPRLRWTNRLVERMTALGFTPADPVYAAALRARDALMELHVAAHYASMEHGVGRGE